MFEKNERGEIPFYNAVKCAVATLTDKIISSDSDLIGICFFGTVSNRNFTSVVMVTNSRQEIQEKCQRIR